MQKNVFSYCRSLSESVQAFHFVFELFVEFIEVAHLLVGIALHTLEQLL